MNDSARSEAYLLAAQNGYNANELVQYLEEDKIGGYHVKHELATWPSGSLWESEGQILYALTRYLKPEHIVEIGTLYGCSATHFATALMKNGSGRITVVDNRANGKFGELIPLDKWAVIDKVEGDGGDYLESLPDNSVDLIFEDAGHGEEDVYRFTLLALRKLKAGGLLINHDAGHDSAMYWHEQGYVYQVSAGEGAMIRAGLTRAGAQFQVYKPHESDCGFAVTRKPPFLPDISIYDNRITVDPPHIKVDSEAIESEPVTRKTLHMFSVLDPIQYVEIEDELAPGVTITPKADNKAIEPEPLTMDEILSAGSPLNGDSFLKPMPTLPPDGIETLEALEESAVILNTSDVLGIVETPKGITPDEIFEFKVTEMNIGESGNSGTFTMEREPTEPPAEKKPRKRRTGKGKT